MLKTLLSAPHNMYATVHTHVKLTVINVNHHPDIKEEEKKLRYVYCACMLGWREIKKKKTRTLNGSLPLLTFSTATALTRRGAGATANNGPRQQEAPASRPLKGFYCTKPPQLLFN